MTKYCPSCESEYQDSVQHCTDDGETLLDAPAQSVNRARAVDIYASANEIEAKLIVGFLSDAGLPAQLFRPQVSQIPMLGETHFVVAVHQEDAKAALEHIRIALKDGVLASTGVFL